MPHLSDNQFDDCIAYALQSETQVTSAQKHRAWEKLRQKVEARIAAQDGQDTCAIIESIHTNSQSESALPVVVDAELLPHPESAARTVNEPGAPIFLFRWLGPCIRVINASIDESARFLFCDEFSLERARQYNPSSARHHLLMASNYAYARA